MSVRIYTHDACLAHDTGPGHVERPPRLTAVIEALRAAFDDLDWQSAPRAGREQLLRVHSPGLLEAVLAPQRDRIVALDPDTMLSPRSAEAALRAAGALVAAVDAACAGDAIRAFCAVRPPGHHATADTAMGFCLFNNIAVAAAHALERHGLVRVAIVDFDVHHGNGTQDVFEHEPRVMYVSSHQSPLYPGTGSAGDRGAGNIRNAPLSPGAGSRRFRETWEQALLPAIDEFRPQLLLVSAGFDAHWRDPLAQMQLDADDFGWLTAKLVLLANRHAAGRMISALEGGYDLQALAECSVAHVAALKG
jgi:acetoin utilization deacetylase AcuC-like enzyme